MPARKLCFAAPVALTIFASIFILPASAQVEFTVFQLPTVGNPMGITTGPNGDLWFTEQTGNYVSSISTSGVLRGRYPVPTASSGPYAIVSGPDSALWFVELNGGKVGRISTQSRIITEFTIPSASSNPWGITLGPDSALWFTESGPTKVGRITTAGTISEYLAPISACATPTGITTALDGNLWFATWNGRLCSVTPAGSLANQAPVPTQNAGPDQIVVGPDGALWFTERTGNKIGRATTGGTTTEYTVPTASANPGGITVGPDGALWFTEQHGGAIGRITTSGAITEYAVPVPGGNPMMITLGPDNALWITVWPDRIVRAIPISTPVLSGISPSSGTIGNSISVTLTGSNFSPATTLVTGAAGVSFSNINVTSSTQMTATLTLGSGTQPGGFSVQAANGAGTSNAVTFSATVAMQIQAVPASLTFAYMPGGSIPVARSVAITTNTGSTPVSAVASSSGAWLSVSPSGPLTTPASFNVAVSPTGLPAGSYTGTVQFTSPSAVNSPYAVSVSLQVGCAYTVTSGDNIPYYGGSTAFMVNTDPACSWSFSGQPGWASCMKVGGTGSGSVLCTAGANPGTSSRMSSITIAGQTVSLVQDGPNSGGLCTLSADVSSRALSVPAVGGAGAISVSAITGCPWTVSSDQPWLTILSGANGSGKGTIQWSAAANASALKRSATLTIRSANNLAQAVSQSGLTGVALSVKGTLYITLPGGSGRAPVSSTTRAIPLSAHAPVDAADNPIAAGSVLRFSETVTNRGQGTATTTVTGTLDSNIHAQACTVSTGGNCSVSGNHITAALGTLGPGQSASVDVTGTVSVTLPSGTILTTTMQASSTEANATPEDSNLTAVQLGVDNTGAATLALAISPVGGGNIASNPVSTNGQYLPGAKVELSAIPAPGYQFDGWTGDLIGNDNPLTVTMNAARSLRANFSPAISGGLRFVPLTPCRVLDTRNATGPFGGPALTGGGVRDFPISASACSVPGTALAYSLNITAVPAGALGYLTVWPTGQPQPTVSTLNSDGRFKANAALVPAGNSGAISVFATDTTHLVVDINGYFVPTSSGTASALAFYPVTPCRIADTRNVQGTYGGPPFPAGSTRTFPVAGSVCGIPAGAQAVSLNLTVVPRGFLGYMTIWPAGQNQPLVSTLNAPRGNVVANAALVPLGSNGAVNVFLTDAADMVMDINGYFAAPGSGGLAFYPTAPCRIADSRDAGRASPFGTPRLTAGETRTYAIPQSACGVPSGAQAWALNNTVVPAGSLGYLTLYPGGTARPWVSTLNAGDGTITANAAIVPAGTSGQMSVYVTDATEFLFDISGYFAP